MIMNYLLSSVESSAAYILFYSALDANNPLLPLGNIIIQLTNNRLKIYFMNVCLVRTYVCNG